MGSIMHLAQEFMAAKTTPGLQKNKTCLFVDFCFFLLSVQLFVYPEDLSIYCPKNPFSFLCRAMKVLYEHLDLPPATYACYRNFYEDDSKMQPSTKTI